MFWLAAPYAFPFITFYLSFLGFYLALNPSSPAMSTIFTVLPRVVSPTLPFYTSASLPWLTTAPHASLGISWDAPAALHVDWFDDLMQQAHTTSPPQAAVCLALPHDQPLTELIPYGARSLVPPVAFWSPYASLWPSCAIAPPIWTEFSDKQHSTKTNALDDVTASLDILELPSDEPHPGVIPDAPLTSFLYINVVVIALAVVATCLLHVVLRNSAFFGVAWTTIGEWIDDLHHPKPAEVGASVPREVSLYHMFRALSDSEVYDYRNARSNLVKLMKTALARRSRSKGMSRNMWWKVISREKHRRVLTSAKAKREARRQQKSHNRVPSPVHNIREFVIAPVVGPSSTSVFLHADVANCIANTDVYQDVDDTPIASTNDRDASCVSSKVNLVPDKLPDELEVFEPSLSRLTITHEEVIALESQPTDVVDSPLEDDYPISDSIVKNSNSTYSPAVRTIQLYEVYPSLSIKTTDTSGTKGTSESLYREQTFSSLRKDTARTHPASTIDIAHEVIFVIPIAQDSEEDETSHIPTIDSSVSSKEWKPSSNTLNDDVALSTAHEQSLKVPLPDTPHISEITSCDPFIPASILKPEDSADFPVLDEQIGDDPYPAVTDSTVVDQFSEPLDNAVPFSVDHNNASGFIYGSIAIPEQAEGAVSISVVPIIVGGDSRDSASIVETDRDSICLKQLTQVLDDVTPPCIYNDSASLVVGRERDCGFLEDSVDKLDPEVAVLPSDSNRLDECTSGATGATQARRKAGPVMYSLGCLSDAIPWAIAYDFGSSTSEILIDVCDLAAGLVLGGLLQPDLDIVGEMNSETVVVRRVEPSRILHETVPNAICPSDEIYTDKPELEVLVPPNALVLHAGLIVVEDAIGNITEPDLECESRTTPNSAVPFLDGFEPVGTSWSDDIDEEIRTVVTNFKPPIAPEQNTYDGKHTDNREQSMPPPRPRGKRAGRSVRAKIEASLARLDQNSAGFSHMQPDRPPKQSPAPFSSAPPRSIPSHRNYPTDDAKSVAPSQEYNRRSNNARPSRSDRTHPDQMNHRRQPHRESAAPISRDASSSTSRPNSGHSGQRRPPQERMGFRFGTPASALPSSLGYNWRPEEQRASSSDGVVR